MCNSADFWLEVVTGLLYIFASLCFSTTLINGLSHR